ncbi:hypothetical protein ISS05_03365 [Candidatus Woesearchaeota archaeon]|nr:hypothetical protein [Candidatus Woesearchaeota archaeon]
MKKAQGMSVNVIIIAAIALIVLVVLVAVFTGRFGLFAAGVKSTGDPTKACGSAENGGKLLDTCPAGQRVIVASDIPPGQFCCKS